MSLDTSAESGPPPGSPGDRVGFRELFERFAPRVRGYYLKRGLEASAAEELTQDVMATLWAKARLYDPGRASLSTWVFTIARNKHIDAVRRGRRPQPDPDDPCWVPGGERTTPEELTETRRRERGVHAALERLSPEHRDTLQLLYFEGRSMAETARALELPLGTIKSRSRRALAALRRIVEEARP